MGRRALRRRVSLLKHFTHTLLLKHDALRRFQRKKSQPCNILHSVTHNFPWTPSCFYFRTGKYLLKQADCLLLRQTLVQMCFALHMFTYSCRYCTVRPSQTNSRSGVYFAIWKYVIIRFEIIFLLPWTHSFFFLSLLQWLPDSTRIHRLHIRPSGKLWWSTGIYKHRIRSLQLFWCLN